MISPDSLALSRYKTANHNTEGEHQTERGLGPHVGEELVGQVVCVKALCIAGSESSSIFKVQGRTSKYLSHQSYLLASISS